MNRVDIDLERIDDRVVVPLATPTDHTFELTLRPP